MLKNFYGCIFDCKFTHENSSNPGPGCHYCIPDTYKLCTEITPCVLNIMDALASTCDEGPGSGVMFHPNVIAASQDPMTLEYYGMELLNAAKTDNGLPVITVDTGNMVDGYDNAAYLAIAASTSHNLGNYNAGTRVSTGTVGILSPYKTQSLENPVARLSGLSRYAGGWRLGLVMDASGRDHRITSKIFDIRGRQIRDFNTVSTQYSRYSIEWNGKDSRGLTVASGYYMWQVTIDGKNFHQRINVL
jgi:hypothetical protein